ncbi:MAG: EscU/YscU/HrcU family type III secretion system export apparatus switch protein [Lachnospiraceae bacterium]|nr:EscU/YscU/HrcU family type III secretion system export apparatus switch protein [Lachnospiraceae bacterium]MBR1816843.1 EscU/YscU/HrcU family type III secretion system export apparatus switch protein [Lachnospiraceae bacterium]
MEYGYNKNSGRAGGEGEKKRKAVALVYEPGSQAPQVIASGKGVMADKIIEKAKESDVPLYKDTNLADTLLNLDIGDCIPPELYGVVAEILVYVDKMDKIKAKLNM